MKRKAFIDCGAWNGNSTRYAQIKLGGTWEYYAFECGDDNFDKLKMNSSSVVLIKAAVWDRDGELKFNLSPANKGMSHSVVIPSNKQKVVPCIDFSNWLKNNFKSMPVASAR